LETFMAVRFDAALCIHSIPVYLVATVDAAASIGLGVTVSARLYVSPVSSSGSTNGNVVVLVGALVEVDAARPDVALERPDPFGLLTDDTAARTPFGTVCGSTAVGTEIVVGIRLY
jgi:hypothetical protein